MIYSTDGLRKDTVALIKDIEAEIEKIKAKEVNEADRMGARMAILLNSKAVAYNTLVMLQTNDRPSGSSTRPSARR